MFLCKAKPTSFCDGIPWCSFLDDIPFYCIGNAIVFQAPDIGTEGGAISVSIVHVLLVILEPAFEGLTGGPCVGLLVAGVCSSHCCPVHNVADGATYAREYQTCVRIFTRAGAMISLGCCSI